MEKNVMESKLLIITDSWEVYRIYVKEHKLSVNNIRRIGSYEDVLGFSSPAKYVLLTPLKSDLPKVLDYMEYHGITKCSRENYDV